MSSEKKSFNERFAALKAKIHSRFHPEGVEMEMMRYRDNKIASNFGYFGLIFDASAFCVLYSSIRISSQDDVSVLGITSSGVLCGLDVLINIVSLLFLFLAISRMKAYSKGWGIFAICFGVFQIVRPFFYPLALYNAAKTVTVNNVQVTTRILEAGRFYPILILFILSGLLLILAGILSIRRGTVLRNYLKGVASIEGEKMEVR
jgi:hypothetical protein